MLLATACGDDEKRDEAATDSSVSSVAEGRVVEAGAPPAVVPPVVTAPGETIPVTPPVLVPAQGAPDIDAGVAGIDAAARNDVPQADASQVAAPPHPLSGRYAVRTVSYARQKTDVGTETIDLVSKGVLLSVADVSTSGLVTEHLCFLELYNDEGLFSWSSPVGTEKVADSVVRLERRGDVFVRPREEDKTNIAWANANRPSDCPVDGGVHITGCTCVPGDGLPTTGTDCRVRDLDGDGQPGLKLSVGPERPVDPSLAESLLNVQVAGIKAVEWRLPTSGDGRLVGTVEGNLEQVQLSVQGELAGQFGQVRNSACSSDTGHVELVKGDFDCAKLLAARRSDVDSYGVFDPKLDAVRPDATACPDPDCVVDSDGDGSLDCMDGCADDPLKTAPGGCGCGKPDVDANRDGALDCLDSCPNDPAKTAPGRCGCGTPETNSDGDSEPDCNDRCPNDPAKTVESACGCGAPDTNSDGDSVADCRDECPSDGTKTTKGACGCGVAETNSDGDSQPDCIDACDNDPNKTAPGICDCGVADADLNGDGTVDCTDACPNDPAKVAEGVCGCGVPDTNRDGDSLPDCRDQCPDDPARTTTGACGCAPCATNPLVGTYAVRATSYAKSRNGMSAATASKAVSYSLVTIASSADGTTTTLSERSCWAETIPQDSGAPYSWTTPSWAQALPVATRRVVVGAGGTWVATSGAERLGWDPGRQPASCSESSTPPSGWPSSWGESCVCSAAGNALPPYDRNEAPYDCRLTDPDGDGYPGISLYVDLVAPSSPTSTSSALTGARAMAATEGSSRWTITPASDGRHWASALDNSTTQVVGCRGLACTGLSTTTPKNVVCPEALNKVQFVPVTPSSDSCAEIIAQRATLFVTNADGSWPSESACPAP